jgi:hypothetical protein
MAVRPHLILVFGLIAASSSALADEVYRWTDASGAVSYGQKPPADAKTVRRVDVNNLSVIPASNSEADQKLADAYARARSQRLEQEAAESHIAAEKARADLDRQTALLEAQRAQADSSCAGCGDQSGFYYPIYGLSTRGYPGYGNSGYGRNSYGSGQTGPARPRPMTQPSVALPLQGQRAGTLN